MLRFLACDVVAASRSSWLSSRLVVEKLMGIELRLLVMDSSFLLSSLFSVKELRYLGVDVDF